MILSLGQKELREKPERKEGCVTQYKQIRKIYRNNYGTTMDFCYLLFFMLHCERKKRSCSKVFRYIVYKIILK